MNRCLKFSILFFNLFIFVGCSFVNTGGVWTDKSKESQKEDSEPSTRIFSEREIFRKEVDGKINVVIGSSLTNKAWKEENYSYSNNTPHFQYENKKKSNF